MISFCYSGVTQCYAKWQTYGSMYLNSAYLGVKRVSIAALGPKYVLERYMDLGKALHRWGHSVQTPKP